MRLVEALPARRLASCHLTVSQRRCSWTSVAEDGVGEVDLADVASGGVLDV
jgi:hypothetical protein